MRGTIADTALEHEIAALADMARPGLVERWEALYRTAPPKGMSRGFLIRAVAYGVQVKRYGGLKPASARRLLQIAADGSAGKPTRKTAPALQPGARLIREWNGVHHMIEATDRGFIWNGERYRSLSAVARAITGARWSGPRFFGIAA